jgi:hypothetical protein
MSGGYGGGYSGFGGSYISPATSGGSSKGSGSSQSQQSTQVLPSLMAGYNQLLGLNQQNYSNTLNAYNQGQNQLSGGLPSNYASYGQTLGGVGNTLGMGQVLGQNGNWGVAAPAAQAIGQTYAQNTANTTQQMTNAGLGNTTAVGNAQTQNALSASQAYGGLGAQLAQTYAGYQAQEGNAASAAQMQGLGLQSGLSGAEGGTLGSYRYANTMGSLTGNQGSASSQNSQQSSQGSVGPQQHPGTGGPASLTGGNGATIGGGGSQGGGGGGGSVGGGSGGGAAGGGGGGGYTPYSGNFSQPSSGTPGYPNTTGIQGNTQVGYQSSTGNNSAQNAAANNGGFSQTGQPGQDMSGGITGGINGATGASSPYDQAGGGGGGFGGGSAASANSGMYTAPNGQVIPVAEGVSATPPGPNMKPRVILGKNGPEVNGWVPG